jgi:hypothetical protein
MYKKNDKKELPLVLPSWLIEHYYFIYSSFLSVRAPSGALTGSTLNINLQKSELNSFLYFLSLFQRSL